MRARWSFLVAAVLAGHALAQTPGEIAFWESVRDTKNPAELRAYLQQYPSGTFKALAEARLAALEKKPAGVPVAPPSPVAAAAPVVAGAKHVPQVGDTWTYRLSYPRIRGQWGKAAKPPQSHVVTILEASDSTVTDELSIDGGSPLPAQHKRGGVLLQQGAAVFSPYFIVFGGPPGSVQTLEPACSRAYSCSAKVRIAGNETLAVPAGRFAATKYVVEETWRPISGSFGRPGDTAQMNGGRTLTVWYAAEIGRAVKYESRLIVGDMPPMEDPNFDLELVSYKLK